MALGLHCRAIDWILDWFEVPINWRVTFGESWPVVADDPKSTTERIVIPYKFGTLCNIVMLEFFVNYVPFIIIGLLLYKLMERNLESN